MLMQHLSIYTSFITDQEKGEHYLHVLLQLINGHGEVRVVVVVQSHITAGLVQH